ncbi:MAG: vacuolar protein sorting-associated family 51 protein [Bacteroidales bacterium]|nr:vacuolar protein sorting-associated family 51 protein [Bacteroidales bacterium]
MKKFVPKFSLLALVLAFVLSFTGCSKTNNDPVYKDGCFKYADKTYNSFSAAVRAALDDQGGEEKVIYLLDSVTDNEELSVEKEKYDWVTFDLGKHTYVSANGLDFKDVQLVLTGEGSFECRNGALSSDSFIIVDEDFKGRISTPVTLNDAAMAVWSPLAKINISQLRFTGDALFSMDVVSEEPASVVIDRISATGDSEVCAVDGKSVVIKEGGVAHIHNYKLAYDAPANCWNAGYLAYECEDCENYYLEFKEGEIGSCIVENLIHHPAVEPTDTEYGNLEYWECLDCGALYSDAEGKNRIDPMLLPKNYDLPVDVLSSFDKLLGETNYTTASTKSITLAVISAVASTGIAVAKDILQYIRQYKSDQKKYNELKAASDKISDLSKKVENIRGAVEDLNKKVDNISYGAELSKYSNSVSELNNLTGIYFNGYQKILADTTLKSLEKKNQKVDDLMHSFARCFIGSDTPDQRLLNLLRTYNDGLSVGGNNCRNLPEVQAKFTQNIYQWEHQGYGYRVSSTLSDFQKLAESYFIIDNYLIWSSKMWKGEYEINGKIDEALNSALAEYIATWQADVDDMNSRYEKYFVYCGGGANNLEYYAKDYYDLGTTMQDWFDNNYSKYSFPRADNQKETAIQSCEKLLSDVGLAGGFLETKCLTSTYQKYQEEIGENNTRNVMKFIGFPDMKPNTSTEINYFITAGFWDGKYDYYHRNNNDNSWPSYKIFEWYKRKGHSATFSVHSINLPDKPVGNFDTASLREGIGMWASDGSITDPGYKRSSEKYYTVRKINVVQ